MVVITTLVLTVARTFTDWYGVVVGTKIGGRSGVRGNGGGGVEVVMTVKVVVVVAMRRVVESAV